MSAWVSSTSKVEESGNSLVSVAVRCGVKKKSLKLNPIYIKQRIRTRHKNIIVINFEGVIGDYFKKNLIDISCPGLYMRPGSLAALKIL